MAFPTIADADTKNGTQTSNSNAWTLTYPTNIVSGDLLILYASTDGAVGFTFPAGWLIKGGTSPGAVTHMVAIKQATGSETGTFTMNLDASEQGGWRIFRVPVSSWYGGSIGTIGNHDADGFDFLESVVGSPSANPNPPDLNPATWGTEDTLWLASCAIDTSRTISVYPLAGRNTADVSGGSGGATLGLCTTTSAVANLDPGTFTCSSSDDFVGCTCAVRPAVAATPLSPPNEPTRQMPSSLYLR